MKASTSLDEEIEHTTLTVPVVGGSARVAGGSCSQEDPSKEPVQGLVKTCLEVCAVDLTEVCSPTLDNEHAMQRSLSTGGCCRVGDGLEFGDKFTSKQMQQSAANRMTEGLNNKSTVPHCS